MKKIGKLIKNNIIGFVIGVIISGAGVYAATVASSSVSYSNTSSGSSATTVKAALDELYTMAKTKIPDTPFKLGDYFTLVPDASTFTIKAATTGYASDQTITPNELTLWRVIDIHSDGSVDAVSEYVSSTGVYFKGVQGYANFVGGLQTIAQSYSKVGYTISTRMMGYAGQTSTIADISAFDGSTNTSPSTTSTSLPITGTGQEYSGGVLGDTLYLKDYLLVKNVYGNVIANKVGTTTATSYWLSSRRFYYRSATDFYFSGRYVLASGSLSNCYLRGFYSSWIDYTGIYSVRPILTLKSGVRIASGSGTSASPYTLS